MFPAKKNRETAVKKAKQKTKKPFYPTRWNINECASFCINFSLSLLIIQRFVFVTSSSFAPAVTFITLKSFIRKHIVQTFTTCDITYILISVYCFLTQLRGVANMACTDTVFMASCYK